MIRKLRTPLLFALMIAALLAGAYAIVGTNRPAMSGPGRATPAGVLH